MSALLNETSTLVSSWNTSYALPTAAALLASAVLYSTLFPSPPKHTTVQPLGGLSILTAWQFFNRRSDFLKFNFSKTGQNAFSFKVLHVRHHIIIVQCDLDGFCDLAFCCRCQGRGSAQGVFR